MAVYKVRLRTNPAELLVVAEDIDCAMDLVTHAYNCSRITIQRIERCADVKTVLDSCYETAEEKLEALLEALPPCLALNQNLMQDITDTVAFDATGVSGMVHELDSKEG